MDDGGITISFASGAASVGGLAVGVKLLLDMMNRRKNGNGGNGVGDDEKTLSEVKRDTTDIKEISVKLADRSVEQITLLKVMVDETKEQTRLLGKIAGGKA